MNLSIVIPAFNEENRIKETISQILTYVNRKKITYEIIVVDDGSTDKTVSIVKKFKGNIRVLKNAKNSGKGFSVKRGIEAAQFNLVLFSDADLATPIEELNHMLLEIQRADIVIASRNLPTSHIVTKQPFYRQIMGKTFPLLVRCMLISSLKDTQCGFKLFKRSVARRIVALQTIYGFSFDVELLFIAKKMGVKIVEVPVHWIDKKGSKVNIFKDPFKMFMGLIKIRYNAVIGKYN